MTKIIIISIVHTIIGGLIVYGVLMETNFILSKDSWSCLDAIESATDPEYMQCSVLVRNNIASRTGHTI